MITISVTSLDKYKADLDRFPNLAQEYLEPASDEAMGYFSAMMAMYPDEIPDQKYMRNYALQNEWLEVKPVYQQNGGMGFTSQKRITTPYAVWVQDANSQARVHQGRWTTAQEMAERATVLDPIKGIFVKYLKQIPPLIDPK